jgi:hypothetical protein
MLTESSRGPVLCLHEDRPKSLIGAKLAILSVRARCPELPILLSCPEPPDDLLKWAETVSRLQVASWPELRNEGWNVKATLLLRLLDAGFEQVIWLDSDIIVHRDILTEIVALPLETFCAIEETYWGQTQGTAPRTKAWGFEVARSLNSTVNSGVLRATRFHIPLLKAWMQLLQHPKYRAAQAVGVPTDCPLHMVTDQDALTALIGSRDFADVRVLLLKRGRDIAQCHGSGGFTPWERARCVVKGLPSLVHSMGPKPWNRDASPPAVRLNASALRKWLEYLHMELFPYSVLAQDYADATGEDLHWARPVSVPGKLSSVLTGNSPVLREFPLSIFDSAVKALRHHFKIQRYKLHPEFCLESSPLAAPVPDVSNRPRVARSAAG